MYMKLLMETSGILIGISIFFFGIIFFITKIAITITITVAVIYFLNKISMIYCKRKN